MADTASANGESKFGFKNKEKAEETLQILESHDMQYRKLTVRGLLGRAKRVLSMTKAQEKIDNIKAAMEVFENWLEENGGGAANKNSKTQTDDKVDTVPGLGYKDKTAAEQTLKILEGRDPDYQQLAIKGLIRSSQRTLAGTSDEQKLKNIKEAVQILEDFLEKFQSENLIKNNRAYLSYTIVEQLTKISHKHTDELAKEFISCYGGSKANGNYKHLRTMFPKQDDSKSWDIVRNEKVAKLLAKIKAEEAKLFHSDGTPTSLHFELINWAYSPQPDKLKTYLDKKSKRSEKTSKRDASKRKHHSSDSHATSSSEGESPKKKHR